MYSFAIHYCYLIRMMRLFIIYMIMRASLLMLTLLMLTLIKARLMNPPALPQLPVPLPVPLPAPLPPLQVMVNLAALPPLRVTVNLAAPPQLPRLPAPPLLRLTTVL